MTDKEKEAIDRLLKRLKDNEVYKSTQVWLSDDVWAVKTVLSMLEEDEEIEKKDKIIDEMAKTIIEDTAKLDTFWCNGCFKLSKCPFKNVKQCVINYFEKKEEE